MKEAGNAIVYFLSVLKTKLKLFQMVARLMLFRVTRLRGNSILKMGNTLCPARNSCIYLEPMISFF